MSTPIWRNKKLQGPMLYAPPRVREQANCEEESEIAPAPVQDEPGSAEAGQAEHDQTETHGNAEDENEDNNTEASDWNTDALDWLDDAIRAAIELEHPPGGPVASDHEFAGSPPMAPAEYESGDFPPTDVEAGRAYQGDGRTIRLPPPRLEVEVVPEPSAEMWERDRFRRFVPLALAVVFAATVAYGLTTLSTSGPGTLWPKGASQRVAADVSRPEQMPASPPPPPQSRLMVENQQAFVNEPISLAINVERAADNELLLFEGLVQGTTLSAGESTSPSSWQLPSDKLQGLYLYAPKDFVGVMNTAVNLLGSDRRLLDSRAVQLKWVAKPPPPAPASALATAEATAGDPIGTAKPIKPAAEPIDPVEGAILMQKGQASLDAGDISGARVAFRRLADAGMPAAALALARTYDPEFLAAHNFVGMRGDRATARALYQRAKDLGSVEAGRILARMVAN